MNNLNRAKIINFFFSKKIPIYFSIIVVIVFINYFIRYDFQISVFFHLLLVQIDLFILLELLYSLKQSFKLKEVTKKERFAFHVLPYLPGVFISGVLLLLKFKFQGIIYKRDILTFISFFCVINFIVVWYDNFKQASDNFIKANFG